MSIIGSVQNEHLYRAPSIDASYQVLDHLAKGIQMRRLKCEKSMENRRRMPSDGIAFGKVSKTKKKIFFNTLADNECLQNFAISANLTVD